MAKHLKETIQGGFLLRKGILKNPLDLPLERAFLRKSLL